MTFRHRLGAQTWRCVSETDADDVKYIDSRTGELRTEDTPEEYFQEKLYGARDVEYLSLIHI